MDKTVRFVARLVNPDGVVYPGEFDATFETAIQSAAERWPEHRVMTVYPVEHHLRLDWLNYLEGRSRRQGTSAREVG